MKTVWISIYIVLYTFFVEYCRPSSWVAANRDIVHIEENHFLVSRSDAIDLSSRGRSASSSGGFDNPIRAKNGRKRSRSLRFLLRPRIGISLRGTYKKNGKAVDVDNKKKTFENNHFQKDNEADRFQKDNKDQKDSPGKENNKDTVSGIDELKKHVKSGINAVAKAESAEGVARGASNSSEGSNAQPSGSDTGETSVPFGTETVIPSKASPGMRSGRNFLDRLYSILEVDTTFDFLKERDAVATKFQENALTELKQNDPALVRVFRKNGLAHMNRRYDCVFATGQQDAFFIWARDQQARKKSTAPQPKPGNAPQPQQTAPKGITADRQKQMLTARRRAVVVNPKPAPQQRRKLLEYWSNAQKSSIFVKKSGGGQSGKEKETSVEVRSAADSIPVDFIDSSNYRSDTVNYGGKSMQRDRKLDGHNFKSMSQEDVDLFDENFEGYTNGYAIGTSTHDISNDQIGRTQGHAAWHGIGDNSNRLANVMHITASNPYDHPKQQQRGRRLNTIEHSKEKNAKSVAKEYLMYRSRGNRGRAQLSECDTFFSKDLSGAPWRFSADVCMHIEHDQDALSHLDLRAEFRKSGTRVRFPPVVMKAVGNKNQMILTKKDETPAENKTVDPNSERPSTQTKKSFDATNLESQGSNGASKTNETGGKEKHERPVYQKHYVSDARLDLGRALGLEIPKMYFQSMSSKFHRKYVEVRQIWQNPTNLLTGDGTALVSTTKGDGASPSSTPALLIGLALPFMTRNREIVQTSWVSLARALAYSFRFDPRLVFDVLMIGDFKPSTMENFQESNFAEVGMLWPCLVDPKNFKICRNHAAGKDLDNETISTKFSSALNRVIQTIELCAKYVSVGFEKSLSTMTLHPDETYSRIHRPCGVRPQISPRMMFALEYLFETKKVDYAVNWDNDLLLNLDFFPYIISFHKYIRDAVKDQYMGAMVSGFKSWFFAMVFGASYFVDRKTYRNVFRWALRICAAGFDFYLDFSLSSPKLPEEYVAQLSSTASSSASGLLGKLLGSSSSSTTAEEDTAEHVMSQEHIMDAQVDAIIEAFKKNKGNIDGHFNDFNRLHVAQDDDDGATISHNVPADDKTDDKTDDKKDDTSDNDKSDNDKSLSEEKTADKKDIDTSKVLSKEQNSKTLLESEASKEGGLPKETEKSSKETGRDGKQGNSLLEKAEGTGNSTEKKETAENKGREKKSEEKKASDKSEEKASEEKTSDHKSDEKTNGKKVPDPPHKKERQPKYCPTSSHESNHSNAHPICGDWDEHSTNFLSDLIYHQVNSEQLYLEHILMEQSCGMVERILPSGRKLNTIRPQYIVETIYHTINERILGFDHDILLKSWKTDDGDTTNETSSGKGLSPMALEYLQWPREIVDPGIDRSLQKPIPSHIRKTIENWLWKQAGIDTSKAFLDKYEQYWRASEDAAKELKSSLQNGQTPRARSAILANSYGVDTDIWKTNPDKEKATRIALSRLTDMTRNQQQSASDNTDGVNPADFRQVLHAFTGRNVAQKLLAWKRGGAMNNKNHPIADDGTTTKNFPSSLAHDSQGIDISGRGFFCKPGHSGSDIFHMRRSKCVSEFSQECLHLNNDGSVHFTQDGFNEKLLELMINIEGLVLGPTRDVWQGPRAGETKKWTKRTWMGHLKSVERQKKYTSMIDLLEV